MSGPPQGYTQTPQQQQVANARLAAFGRAPAESNF